MSQELLEKLKGGQFRDCKNVPSEGIKGKADCDGQTFDWTLSPQPWTEQNIQGILQSVSLSLDQANDVYYQYQAICDPSHLPVSLEVRQSDPNKPEVEEEEVVIVHETEKVHNTLSRPYLLQVVPPPSDPPLSLLSARNDVVQIALRVEGVLSVRDFDRSHLDLLQLLKQMGREELAKISQGEGGEAPRSVGVISIHGDKRGIVAEFRTARTLFGARDLLMRFILLDELIQNLQRDDQYYKHTLLSVIVPVSHPLAAIADDPSSSDEE